MGEELRHLRAEITKEEEAFAEKIKEMKDKREAVQQELMDSLVGVGLTSIKVSSGETIAVGSRKSYQWASQLDELRFAQQNGCLRPDGKLVAQALGKIKEGEKLPGGVSVVETNFISIRGVKKE